MFLFTDQRRRQVFDWFCAGALAVIFPVEIIVWLVRGNYGPSVFQIFTPHPIPLGTVIILLSPGPVRLIVYEKFHGQAARLAVRPFRRHPDFSHPQAGNLAGAGRHAVGGDNLPGPPTPIPGIVTPFG